MTDIKVLVEFEQTTLQQGHAMVDQDEFLAWVNEGRAEPLGLLDLLDGPEFPALMAEYLRSGREPWHEAIENHWTKVSGGSVEIGPPTVTGAQAVVTWSADR